MNYHDKIELFILKSASMRIAVDHAMPRSKMVEAAQISENQLKSSISQFSKEIRDTADSMAEFYKLFYMLENDIRKLIDDTLTDAYGSEWWEEYSPNSAKEECRLNQQREADFGVTSRSDNNLDLYNIWPAWGYHTT